MLVTTSLSRGRVADRKAVESLLRLVLIIWIVVTIAILWSAVSQGEPRPAKPSSLYSTDHRASAANIGRQEAAIFL